VPAFRCGKKREESALMKRMNDLMTILRNIGHFFGVRKKKRGERGEKKGGKKKRKREEEEERRREGERKMRYC
jgi:hypothetical protein